MTQQDSSDPELDKLILELEKKGEESKPLLEKQIKKHQDEQNQTIDTTNQDYEDKEIPDEAYFD